MTQNLTNDPDALRTFNRELPVPLNDHELQQYGKMLADKVREEELAEEKKKQIAQEHANRIKAIRVEIKRIADARAKGEELRPVKCLERLKNGVIEIVRTDTNAVVDVRPADLRDLQPDLPGTEDPEDEGGMDASDTVGPPGEFTTSSVGDHVFTSSDAEDEPEAGEMEGNEESGLSHIRDIADETDPRNDPTEIETDPFDGGAEEQTSSSPKPRARQHRGKPATNAKAAKKTSAPKKSTAKLKR